jgi:release factor glutamine methyltransferase
MSNRPQQQLARPRSAGKCERHTPARCRTADGACGGPEPKRLLLRARDLTRPAEFDALVQRRLAHEPVAYIRGYQEFWDLTLGVTPDVLIPRGDSETLIEAAIGIFGFTSASHRSLIWARVRARLLLAALSAFPRHPVFAIDASAPRLAVASGQCRATGLW